jgi:hypothetical protein
LACFFACASAKQSSRPAQETKSAPAAEPRAAESAVAPAAPSRGAAPGANADTYGTSINGTTSPEAPPAVITDEARKEAPENFAPRTAWVSARAQTVEARRELEIAISERDCARACRALASMERAARQICALAMSPEEKRECASASDHVEKARTRIQNACGGCSQNPR